MKELVKFYVLRYSASLIVSRTVTGKHKEAYVDLLTIDAIEHTIDVLWEHRGEYMPIEHIMEAVGKRMGFKVKIVYAKGSKDKPIDIDIRYTPPGARRSVKFDDYEKSKFRRTVMYALNACRDLFGITELVKRPGRETPERYIALDRSKNLAARLNDVVERLDRVIDYIVSEEAAYVCTNLQCNVLELYKGSEAERNEYLCKGKEVEKIEYGEAENKTFRIPGCNRPLDEVDVEILERVKALLNLIIEKISQRRTPQAL